MSDSGVPAGWFPDPDGLGGLRYFDGTAWTGHRLPPPMPGYAAYPWWPMASWKGARLGRPPSGPGALASQGRRLGARLLDGLVLLPVLAAFVAIAVAVIVPRAGPFFPTFSNNRRASSRVPGFVWIELGVIGACLAIAVVSIAYETVATAGFDRTLGKAWLHIRPIRCGGGPLGWGRSLGRALLYWLSGFLPFGVLDPLWCLWDENQQCLHDKAVDTIVVNDLSPGVESATPRAPYVAQDGETTDGGPKRWSPDQPVVVPPMYWPAAGYWSFPTAPKTNGLATASVICSIAGFFVLGIPAIFGVIFGFVARSQIRQSRGTQTGESLARTGIIVGFVVIGLFLLVLLPALA